MEVVALQFLAEHRDRRRSRGGRFEQTRPIFEVQSANHRRLYAIRPEGAREYRFVVDVAPAAHGGIVEDGIAVEIEPLVVDNLDERQAVRPLQHEGEQALAIQRAAVEFDEGVHVSVIARSFGPEGRCYGGILSLTEKSPMRVRELAEWLGATYEGDGERELSGVAPLETAGESEVAFVGTRKAAAAAESSAAGCLIVPAEWPNTTNRTVIRANGPRTAFARAMNRFYPTAELKPGVHPTAVIGKDVELGAMVYVGPHAVIGDGTRIGVATSIGAGCIVGKRVSMGEGCVLHPNVTVYDNVGIGRSCILHSGCVIGADGFGFVMEHGRWHKFPQVGRVEIGDFVEVGANSCIDRAALGVTSIGEGTKLDNMVHVGHNCRIGQHVVVAAQTGFSGGVVVEDYAVIGGQVGIGDKARIETRAVLGSGCGVLTSKIVRSGETVWGTPARPLKQHLELLANLARLPEMRKEVTELKRRLAALES